MVLPQGATLRSIVPTLTEEWLRIVLAKATICENQMGHSVVVINLAKTGRCPDYNISAVMNEDTGEAMNWRNFSGATHQPLRSNQERLAIWSAERMTWREVGALLGEIRGFKVKKSAPRT